MELLTTKAAKSMNTYNITSIVLVEILQDFCYLLSIHEQTVVLLFTITPFHTASTELHKAVKMSQKIYELCAAKHIFLDLCCCHAKGRIGRQVPRQSFFYGARRT